MPDRYAFDYGIAHRNCPNVKTGTNLCLRQSVRRVILETHNAGCNEHEP